MSCGTESFNVALWDVTDPSHPFVAPGGALSRKTSPRDRRSHLPVELVLQPARSYRLVARVSEYRSTAIDAPYVEGPLTVIGSVNYADANSCGGAQVGAVTFVDPGGDLDVDPLRLGSRERRPRSPGRHAETGLAWKRKHGALLAGCGRRSPSGAAVQRDERAMQAHLLDTTVGGSYLDPNATPASGERLWYQVNAVNACTAGL